MNKLTELETSIILAINAAQENGRPPTRGDIKRTINAQVDRAVTRLIMDGLVVVIQPCAGYNYQHGLATAPPNVTTDL